MKKTSYDLIYDVVRRIPKGCVATYGQIARLAGNRRWSRVVGYALHVNPDSENIPCYRVVNREGRVSKAFVFGGENRQIALLEQDGIPVKDGCVDLAKYQWREGLYLEELSTSAGFR
ncbi:MAG: MGMT family protein [Lachnospiraceae bacterium]|nr:MGMT family protein [Lachnospiraceae bacterium]